VVKYFVTVGAAVLVGMAVLALLVAAWVYFRRRKSTGYMAINTSE